MRSMLTYVYLFTFIFVPLFARAGEFNVGIVQGLWYSTSTIYANVPIRVYIALRNSTEQDLTGMVRFSDNGTVVGVSPVSALSGRVVEAWADWKPDVGTHTIAASLYNVALNTIGTIPRQITADDTIATDTITVTEAPKINVATTLGATTITSPTSPGNPAFTQNLEATIAAALPTNSPQGLERFMPDGTVHNAMTNVTKTLSSTKTAIDSYRKGQSDEIAPYFGITSSTTPHETGTTNTKGSGAATITRSQLPSDGTNFLGQVIESGRALVGGLFSFVLFLISTILGYPAVVEVVLLLGILYGVYRTARRLGKRQRY